MQPLIQSRLKIFPSQPKSSLVLLFVQSLPQHLLGNHYSDFAYNFFLECYKNEIIEQVALVSGVYSLVQNVNKSYLYLVWFMQHKRGWELHLTLFKEQS